MKVRNLFTSGKMNKDLDERLVPKGEYRHALNAKIANSSGSDVGSIENALSNSKISDISFGSNAKCIGVVEDDASGRIYWCVSSSQGSYVCEYIKESNFSSVVISDERVDNILGFDKAAYVDMSVLNDVENGKTFIIITDNVSEPKYFEVEFARALENSNFLLEDITLIKASPLHAPNITLMNTLESVENNIEDKFMSFAYRYIYENEEASALSPFSEFAFMPKDFSYNYDSGTNRSMLNKFSQVEIAFNTGSSNVKKIEIIGKESGVPTAYILESLSKDDFEDDSEETFVFSNSKIYRALDSRQLLRLYDNVPIRAKTVDIIGGRVVFGSYTENYNVGDVSIRLDHSSTTGENGDAHKTVKSNSDYEVAISYLDGKGRMTTPLTSEFNNTHVPIAGSDKKNSLNVSISSKAPNWAVGYRFFIKQNRSDYDVLSPIIFYQDGNYAYIKIEGADLSKVNEGDFLFIKSDTSGIKRETVRTKILEVGTKDANFLEPSTETQTLQESGVYIKIELDNIALDDASISEYEYNGYCFRSTSTNNNFINDVAYLDPAVFYGDGLNDMSASGTFSASTDIRYEVEITSSGSTDQFRWREFDCKTGDFTAWSSDTSLSSSVALSNGVSVSFAATTGHTVGDKWIVSAKCASERTYVDWGGRVINSNGDYNPNGQRGIMLFKCKKDDGSEKIKAGAIITIEYDDTLSDPGVINRSGYVYQRFTSSSNYENMEEWFYGDNVLSKMSYPVDNSDVLFRRGSLSKTNGEQMQIVASGDLFMAILSQCRFVSTSDAVRINVDLSITELANYVIFETDYSKLSSDVFYELPYTYDISNGNHLGKDGDTNQVFGVSDALIGLDYFNAFGWYNGYESIKIGDSFNGKSMSLDSKPLVPIDNYKEITRIASLTYSEVYEETTSFNGINEFNLSLVNYKDLDAKFGGISRIISRDGDLICIQANRVTRILFNKSVIYNADGSGNISQTTDILGQDIPYIGEYGMTGNLYGACKWANAVYFLDEKRSRALRLGGDGLTVISEYGMISWFNDNLDQSSKVVTGYDPRNEQFVVNISENTIEWREDTYECEQGDITTTTTTESPSTTTTTTESPSTTTTTEGDTTTTTTTEGDITSTTTSTSTSTTTSTSTSTTTSTSTSTSTTTSTTTTTETPVYYSLRRCSDSSSGWRTAQTITQISLSPNDRVEDASLTRYTVLGTTTAGTSVGVVTDTGTIGCIDITSTTTSTSTTTTTTTTSDPYNYYAVRGCPDTFYENRDMYIRTTSTLPDANGNPTTSSSISWNGQSFYAYSTLNQSQWLTGSGDLASITYTGSIGVGCPVITTTTTTEATTTTTEEVRTAFKTHASAGSGSSTSQDACESILGASIYATNASNLASIGIGTRFTTNQTGARLYWQGNNQWYAIDNDGSFGPAPFSVVIDNSGTVTAKTTCSAPAPAAPDTTTTTTCPSSGTLLSTYCSGTTKMGTYANGNCGSYNQVIETNSTDCGYVYPSGTLLETNCFGYDLWGTYADGSGGTYTSLIENNSTSCGYVAQTAAGTLLSTYCDGTTKMGTYANGSGGSYNQVIETNSTDCGYVAPTTQAPTTQAPTTQAPADNVFVVEASGVVGDYIQMAQGYGIGDFIVTSVHGSTCVEIMNTAYVVNPGAFGTVTGPCPPPTTQAPTTQAPSTAGYSCINNSCQYVSSGAQYSTLKACNAACGNQQ